VQQNAKNSAEASEQFFRSIFENAQIGISFFNIDGSTVFSNRALHEMLGYTGEELSHVEKWDAIIHPDERAFGAERYAELVQGKHDNDEWEQRFVRKDGSIVVANGRFSLLRDAAGKPQYVASLTEDITESKRAQEERNRIAKQMEMLLESTGQGIYGIDLQGNCTFINRATCGLIGYRAEELLGRKMHDLMHHHKPDGSVYPIEECPVYRACKKGARRSRLNILRFQFSRAERSLAPSSRLLISQSASGPRKSCGRASSSSVQSLRMPSSGSAYLA
jgi:PAS domain S-box-containing protein